MDESQGYLFPIVRHQEAAVESALLHQTITASSSRMIRVDGFLICSSPPRPVQAVVLLASGQSISADDTNREGMVTVSMLFGLTHEMDGDPVRPCRRAVWVDAKPVRLRLLKPPSHRAGQALVYAFRKRQPYIMRP